VAGTRIFARASAGGEQLLAYAMTFAADEDLAMVLPLPCPPNPAEDAVRFIDLSAYPDLFVDLEKAFPMPKTRGGGAFAPAAIAPPPPKLRVHRVGGFEASFVPSTADFDRLDNRFRLPARVWDALPHVRDWAFAVFKLREAVGTRGVHPMAFVFPRRDPGTIFFPTVHVHDGEVHSTAPFDHVLYCQPDALVAATLGWRLSESPLERWVDAERTAGLIDGSAPCFRMPLQGQLLNVDVTLTPPAFAGRPESLSLRGVHFHLRVRATAAYDTFGWTTAAHRDTARTKLDRLLGGLREGLRELTASHATEWSLVTWSPELPRGAAVAYGAPFLPWNANTPCRLTFSPSTDRVEMQHVELAFAVPPPAEVAAKIDAALKSLLDAVVA
jgi:hypothetical protein